jgi:hypothetical protein
VPHQPGTHRSVKQIRDLTFHLVRKQRVFFGNGQQFLLRQVRDFLAKHYPLAKINEEGHLLIPFSYEISIEFIPAFLNAKKNYTYPDIHNGGSWVNFNPLREIEVVDEANFNYNGKVKHLAKMKRPGRPNINVPLNGMLLDTLV